VAGAVHVGGIEERNAKIKRAMDGGDGLLFAAAGVKFRHSHAAEAKRGNGKIGGEMSDEHDAVLRG
jgi:hypothetical protein